MKGEAIIPSPLLLQKVCDSVDAALVMRVEEVHQLAKMCEEIDQIKRFLDKFRLMIPIEEILPTSHFQHI